MRMPMTTDMRFVLPEASYIYMSANSKGDKYPFLVRWLIKTCFPKLEALFRV